MIDITIARAIHVLAIVHWIGGVAMVTAVLLPAVMRFAEPAQRFRLFETIEHGFSAQAKVSVTLAGLSGFYMTQRLAVWDRFLEVTYWWMHAMVIVWVLFMFMLFVAEPLFLHSRLRHHAQHNPDAALALLQTVHWLLLSLSAITVAAAVMGAHGMF